MPENSKTKIDVCYCKDGRTCWMHRADADANLPKWDTQGTPVNPNYPPPSAVLQRMFDEWWDEAYDSSPVARADRWLYRWCRSAYLEGYNKAKEIYTHAP